MALLGRERIDQEQKACNVLGQEEKLSLGSGASSDLLKTAASRDTSSETWQKRCPAFKEKFPCTGVMLTFHPGFLGQPSLLPFREPRLSVWSEPT